MHIELLDILCCPKTGSSLTLKNPIYKKGRVHSGILESELGQYSYPVQNFIPRFVAHSNYADNFGMQWNKFSKTQLDSHSGHPISAGRFWKATGWQNQNISGQWMLDVGCGAGRFAEVALEAGAKVVALDYSTAVDACYANLMHHDNLNVVQGDIFSLPFRLGQFPFVYSLGVLQHTPDVKKAFTSLPPMVKDGGRLCADFYWKRLRTMLHMKYLLRPFTKRMAQEHLFAILQKGVPHLLRVSQQFGRVPIVGRGLKRLIPVADYSGIYPLDQKQIREWALLDTFDMLAPKYDSPQTSSTIARWMADAGFVDVEVFQANLLVVRGLKP